MVLERDLKYLITLSEHIDEMYNRNETETYHYLKKLRKIIDRFNMKYPGVRASVRKTHLKIYIRFFIYHESINEAFIELKEGDHPFRRHPSMQKSLGDADKVTGMLALRKDMNRNMVEIVYRRDTILDRNSAEFQLLAIYGLPDYNPKMKIQQEKDDVFCFDFSDQKDEGIVYSPDKEMLEINY